MPEQQIHDQGQLILFADEPEPELRYFTHTFAIEGHEAWITVGLDGREEVKEIGLEIARIGSLVAGLTEGISRMATLALRHGVPLQAIVAELKDMRFEPSGRVGNTQGIGTRRVAITPAVLTAKSFLDYIARWLEVKFVNNQGQGE